MHHLGWRASSTTTVTAAGSMRAASCASPLDNPGDINSAQIIVDVTKAASALNTARR